VTSESDPADLGPSVLALRAATIGYDGRPVVTGVDLAVARGEVVAVVGANGSGKSTLLRGALGLAPLLAGSIAIFGTRVEDLRDRWRVGYVPQRDSLIPGLPATVGEVVASGRLPQLRPWRRFRARDRERIRAAIATVGLEDRAREPVTRLSGGQQRRVLVARALAADAELLLLDEPTAGVDAENQHILANTLAQLAQHGATIVLVTHELGPAAGIVTRLIAMRDGQIAYDGPPENAPHFDHGLDHHHLPVEPTRRGSFGLTG
jgi:zinc transport system ATP-binding protein